MLSIFSYVSGPSFFGESVCSSPLPIFYLGCLSSWSGVLWVLYIYWRSGPLSEVSLANMFSHTVGSLCNLVLFSLAMQKLFILRRSHLFILSFVSLALGDVSVRMLLCGMSEIFLPMFSSRTFMVSQLTFKSFIHLEFTFPYGVSWWWSFLFLRIAV